MGRWAIVFLIITILAAIVGFAQVTFPVAADIAQLIFFMGLVVILMSIIARKAIFGKIGRHQHWWPDRY